MKEIFEQYGSVIIAAVAISALVAIIVMLLATDGVVANSFVYDNLKIPQNIIENSSRGNI